MSKRVLICPLDWGLGHATRCIPVIRQILKDGHEVLIAGSGASLHLLKLEFPSLKFFELPTKTIRHFSEWPIVRLFLQSGRLWNMIRVEQRETAKIVEREKIDRIISDNRYGCYHHSVRSVIIIHQLSLQGFLGGLANIVNEKLIGRFNECWVPDSSDHLLSGALSLNKNIDAKFIGPLSRLKKNAPAQITFQVLGMISGPEPARSDFENLLAPQLETSGFSYKIIQGLPAWQDIDTHTFSHRPSSQLGDLIESAEVVISRPGYSTIMDLAALNKKAIFVPTPGQTEQLYLAKEMQRKKIAPAMSQQQFNLPHALEELKNYTGFTEDYFNNNLLQNTLREFLD